MMRPPLGGHNALSLIYFSLRDLSMNLRPFSLIFGALCVLLTVSPTAQAQFPCAKWLTDASYAQAQKFLAKHPSLQKSLAQGKQVKFDFSKLDLTSNFNRSELLPLSQFASFYLNLEGHQDGELWRGIYYGQQFAMQNLLAYLAPEWIKENSNFPSLLAKAWQNFAPIYLHKIKMWHFPYAPYFKNLPPSKNAQRILTLVNQGIVIEWRTPGYYLHPNFWAVYLRRPSLATLTVDQITNHFAQALATVWAQELSANQEFMAKWKAAAKLDHASTAFSADQLIPLLLGNPPAKFQNRQKVFAAAAYTSWQKEALPLPLEKTISLDRQNLSPRANIYEVLEVMVSIKADPLAAEEKKWAQQFQDITPELSLFYGRQSGIGKLYQVARRYRDEVVHFKVLIEDFSAHPAIERQALNQIRWIAAIIPGKYWRQISTLHILPKQPKTTNRDQFSFILKSHSRMLVGQARLKVTTSLQDFKKKDVVLFLEEGLPIYFNNPGLGQHLARDLEDWLNTHLN